jgi:hypothetical protein
MAENETYARELRWILSEIAACLHSLRVEAEQLRTEIEIVFSRTFDEDLDRPATALAHWEGREPPSGTRRDAIVEAIRHGGVHLGELRLTVDLANAASESQR